MSKEIDLKHRFRAWYKVDDEHYEMIYDVQNTHDNLADCGSRYHANFGDVLTDEDAIVEQCSGILDIKGVPIYAGDIIRAPSGVEYEVVQLNGGFMLKLLYNGSVNLPLSSAESPEVVGNIHEGKVSYDES